MMLSLLEIRNRMLNCKPQAIISVEFCEEDMVRLGWKWVGTDDNTHVYHIDVEIHHLGGNCRSFERQMNKAKRYLKHKVGV